MRVVSASRWRLRAATAFLWFMDTFSIPPRIPRRGQPVGRYSVAILGAANTHCGNPAQMVRSVHVGRAQPMVFRRLMRGNLGTAIRLAKLDIPRLLLNRRRRTPHLREPVAEEPHEGREVEVHGREIDGLAAHRASALRGLGKQIAIEPSRSRVPWPRSVPRTSRNRRSIRSEQSCRVDADCHPFLCPCGQRRRLACTVSWHAAMRLETANGDTSARQQPIRARLVHTLGTIAL
jgi:hypothetical protein